MNSKASKRKQYRTQARDNSNGSRSLAQEGTSLKNHFVGIAIASVLWGCSVLNKSSIQRLEKRDPTSKSFGLFTQFLIQNPQGVWGTTIAPNLSSAIRDFADSKVLPNDRIYGHSAKHLDIRNQTAASLKSLLLKAGFTEKQCTFWDFSKKPRRPKVDSNGEIIPIWVFWNHDGSKVLVKPNGDSTSAFRKNPDAYKAVLYPFDADPCEWSSDSFLVDNEGQALPKWPQDMNNPFPPDSEQSRLFLEDWSNRVHSSLIQ